MFQLRKILNLLRNPRYQFWVLFILLIFIRFWPFFWGKTLVFGDNYSLQMPGKIFAAEWLSQGVLPLWNPYLFSGISTLMLDAHQSILYPSTLLFILFPPALALNLTIILHLLLAYAGMYLLARTWLKDHAFALVAAVLWMLSTQITGSINNLVTLQSLVWLPLLAFFGLQLARQSVYRWWFAGAFLLQFLGGYPQHALYGVILAVMLSAFFHWRQLKFQQWFLAWFWTGLTTLGMAAVAWLPFIVALPNSTRVLQTETQALVGSLNPAMLVKFVLPYFFDQASEGIKWGPAWSGQPNVAIYVTWLGLLAALSSFWVKKKTLKKEVWFFAGLTFFTLVFSLGENLPGFAVIQKVIPFFRIARYPSMMMILTNVVLALWTARGLQQWQINTRTFRWLAAIGWGILAMGLASWWAHRNWFPELWQAADRFVSFSLSESLFHTLERDKLIVFEIIKNIVFNSLFFIALISVFRQNKRQFRLLLVAFIIGLEMIFNTHGQFFFAPKEIYATSAIRAQELLASLALPKTAFQARVLTRNLNLPYTDYGSYWEALVVRAPFSDSFVDEQELAEFNHAQVLRDGLTPNWNMVFGVPVVNGYTTLLPTDYAQLYQRSANEPRINFIEQIDPADPLLDDWAVRYYVVDTWFEIKEDLGQLPVVTEIGNWQVRERPGAKERIRFGDDTVAELTEFEENPNQLSFSLENFTDRPNLIIADRYDPDWQARVNGQLIEIENYHGMRRIPLRPGANQVELWYWPKWFYVGLAVTLTSGLVMLVQLRKK
ncbi:MAG TPA: hypothetical protein VGA89_01165 [Patescibacteria group bacterium]|jgi:hypothetical protein